jgi:hypothetical protein
VGFAALVDNVAVVLDLTTLDELSVKVGALIADAAMNCLRKYLDDMLETLSETWKNENAYSPLAVDSNLSHPFKKRLFLVFCPFPVALLLSRVVESIIICVGIGIAQLPRSNACLRPAFHAALLRRLRNRVVESQFGNLNPAKNVLLELCGDM